MNHRQRLEVCLAGEAPDRTPVALWRHFPVDDQTPDALAEAVLAFQRTYDFDFIKVTPESTYSVKDWGVEDEWCGAPEGTRDYTHRPIQTPEDWTRLKALVPHMGRLADQLTCLRLLVSELGEETPIIETIFSPLAQANKMVGNETLLTHMRRYPDALHAGLKTITESTIRFIETAQNTGIAGIFYALQHAQYGLLSRDEYMKFGRAYDLQVLEPSKALWFNVLHLHGEEVMFDLVKDYPVQVVNWHDRETSPTLSEAQEEFDGLVCGGIRQWQTMALGTPNQVMAEARDAIEETKGRRFILGTGCVTPIITPHGNLIAARNGVVD